MGLKISGNIVSRAVSLARTNVPSTHNRIYIDDLLQHAHTFQDYLDVIKRILSACIKSNIRLNGKTCSFLQKSAI